MAIGLTRLWPFGAPTKTKLWCWIAERFFQFWQHFFGLTEPEQLHDKMEKRVEGAEFLFVSWPSNMCAG